MKKTINGYTLTEIAIAILIISIISVGILSGAKLIENARVKHILTELTQIRNAMATFETEYDAIPGDFDKAERFFFYTYGVGVKNGNGDGVISTLRDQGSSPNNDNLLAVDNSGFKQSSEAGHTIMQLKEGGFLNIKDFNHPQITSENPSILGSQFSEAHCWSLIFTASQDVWQNTSGSNKVITSPDRSNMNYPTIVFGKVSTITQYGFGCILGHLKAGITKTLDAKVDDGLPLTGEARFLGGKFADGGLNEGIVINSTESGTSIDNTCSQDGGINFYKSNTDTFACNPIFRVH